LAKIAAVLERALRARAASGAPGRTASRVLAEGEGWSVSDVVCTSGPSDRVFEERHEVVSISIVAAGSFQYRSARGRDLMTPGSLLLGNPGEHFECRHDHAAGDRCLSFKYAPEYFERLVADAATGPAAGRFPILRVPPLRPLAPLVARACAGLVAIDTSNGGAGIGGDADLARDRGGLWEWERLSIELAALTLRILGDPSRGAAPDAVARVMRAASPGAMRAGRAVERHPTAPAAMARVTRAVRVVERHTDSALRLATLAREAGLSPFHFLRTFERVTELTPHQYVLRTRLREAGIRLAQERTRVGEIAFGCGFGDLSSFNRAFRNEFGVSPREFRRRTGRGGRPADGAGGVN
jgi:AraC-like DNA-binding protein